VAKLFIHVFLDRRNSYKTEFTIVSLLQYYFLYKKQVAKDEKWKKVCNDLLKLAICLFVLDIIVIIFSNFLSF